MKTLKKIVHGISSLVDHWEKWKWEGLLLLRKRLLNPNKIIEIKIRDLKQPVYLRNNTSDITVFYQVFFQNSYNFDYSSPVDVIIDCGANIGLSSIFYAHHFPKATIVAVEPERNNFKMLERNCRPFKNIISVRAGVWNKNTNLRLLNKTDQPWGMQVEEAIDQKSAIEAVSLPYLLQKYNLKKIDILKVDIEGSEKELFETGTDDWLPFTKILCIELHDHLRKGASQSFFKALSEYEYSMFKRKENLIFYLNH